MKKFILLFSLLLLGCEDTPLHMENGHYVVRLDCNQKLVTASDESHTGYNYISRPMHEGEVPETYTHRSGAQTYRLIESRCPVPAPTPPPAPGNCR